MSAAASGRFHKLFVGNLPWSVGHQELRQYFREFGRVISANVVFDKQTGCSKGYGFVIFSNKNALATIEAKSKLTLEGHNLNIQPTA